MGGWQVEDSYRVKLPREIVYFIVVNNQFALSGDMTYEGIDCYIKFTASAK